MTQPIILTDIDARGVATITLNRPEVNNAYNGEFIAQLTDAVVACAQNDKVRVLVIRGNGKHFQAGADLRWLKEIGALSPAENVEISRRTTNAVQGLNTLPKPTVALVHGGCYGGGVGMLSACDVVIASEDATFAITEARWGVMAGVIVPHLNAAIGPRNVRRYALTCERFDAAEAMRIGLVHQVCPTGGLDDAAAPVIDHLLLSEPNSTAQTKQVMLEHAGLDLSAEELEKLIVQHAEKRQTAEAREGLDSFAEKRKPSWYTG
jgi:methylglutaconyl-CoA hydratase